MMSHLVAEAAMVAAIQFVAWSRNIIDVLLARHVLRTNRNDTKQSMHSTARDEHANG